MCMSPSCIVVLKSIKNRDTELSSHPEQEASPLDLIGIQSERDDWPSCIIKRYTSRRSAERISTGLPFPGFPERRDL